MTDDDVRALLRHALAAQAHELVPDAASRPPLDLLERRAPKRVLPVGSGDGRRRHHRWWIASGLAVAAAAVVVATVLTVGSAASAQRHLPGPVPAATGPTGAPTPIASVSATADPGPTAPPVPPTATGSAVPTTLVVDSGIAVYANCTDPANNAPTVEPSDIVLACADNGEVLEALHWTTWTPTRATATGTLTYKSCRPDCASGGFAHVRGVSVTLTDPVRSPGGAVVWSTATVSPDPVKEVPGPYTLPTTSG